jgi:hypothetical protein
MRELIYRVIQSCSSILNERVCEILGSHGGEYDDRALWHVGPCSLGVHRRFRGAYCLHNQGDESGDESGKKLFTFSVPSDLPNSLLKYCTGTILNALSNKSEGAENDLAFLLRIFLDKIEF